MLRSRTRAGFLAVALLLAIASTTPAPALAAWAVNGNVVCGASGNQTYPLFVTDNSGGFFVVWQDDRGGSADLYAQRMTSAGSVSPGWPASGVAIVTATGDQKLAVAAPDGSGGLYVAWEDYRAGGGESDVYLQRLTANGAISPGWTTNGRLVCGFAGPQGYPALLADATGAFVAWQDDRSTTSSDIYIQRVSSAGVAQWTASGVALCTAGGNQLFPSIAPDATTGVYVAWQDPRNGDPDVYVQRVNASGAAQWTADGVPVCTALYEQLAPRMVPDGSDGVVIAWDDYRDFNADIYAQRLNGSGTKLWAPADGVALCTDLAEQYGAGIVSDGAGGAIVPWTDYRGGAGDIYAQRVTSAGSVAPAWPADGAAVCTATGDQFDATACADGSGGAYVVWSDARTGTGTADIYAKQVTSSGGTALGWNVNGSRICDALNAQLRPAVLLDGAGCFIVWSDERGADSDIYAARGGGSTVDVAPWEGAPAVELAAPFPNPSRGSVTLRFTLSGSGPVRLTVLDLAGRRVRALLNDESLGTGMHTVLWNGLDEAGMKASTGLYWVVLETADARSLRKVTVLK